jgi:hypothetical protein
MGKRPYYSIRTGKNPYWQGIDFPFLKRLFRDLYLNFLRREYFQEAFGYNCVDAGNVPGKLGDDIEAQILRSLRKEGLWPIHDKCLDYSEDDLFDIIEFLYDCISKPIPHDGDYHSWNQCGWHYSEFDQQAGREEFGQEINEILREYNSGFELSAQGEILALPEQGLDHLLRAALPKYDPRNVEGRVEAAIHKFRSRRSSLDDRRDAVRDLADVLEFMRPQLRQVLSRKDENDLFNIANNFGIRHHRERQKTNYDQAIWYSWMFYYYLATIHASVRLLQGA